MILMRRWRMLSLIVNSPKELGKFYRELWRADHADALEHYYQVRESFNRTQDARLLLRPSIERGISGFASCSGKRESG